MFLLFGLAAQQLLRTATLVFIILNQVRIHLMINSKIKFYFFREHLGMCKVIMISLLMNIEQFKKLICIVRTVAYLLILEIY